MVTTRADNNKAKGRFFEGLFISPELISTDSNPPKAKINKKTEDENEDNVGAEENDSNSG